MLFRSTTWSWIKSLLFLICFPIMKGIKLPDVYWNQTNPMFKTSANANIIEVKLYDQIDFKCPHFTEAHSKDKIEYYIIYRVLTKYEFDHCLINEVLANNLLVNCSSPYEVKRFTILFTHFSATPGGTEFKEGETYYYITTSNGSKSGLNNQFAGGCANNMKIQIKVAYSNSKSPSPPIPPAPSKHIIPEIVRFTPSTTSVPWKAKFTKLKPIYDNNENEVNPKKDGLISPTNYCNSLTTNLYLLLLFLTLVNIQMLLQR